RMTRREGRSKGGGRPELAEGGAALRMVIQDLPARPNPVAPRVGVGEEAEDLEHHGGADERGVAGGVEGRRDLDDVAADEVEALQAADQALRLARGEAADLG